MPNLTEMIEGKTAMNRDPAEWSTATALSLFPAVDSGRDLAPV